MTSNVNSIAPVYGLVLAGGKSSRMGIDKGSMEWTGRKQRYVIADMLNGFCEHVFISCRKDQSGEIVGEGYQVIEDTYDGLGPYGALLSAFKFKSDVAWFVLACDLPLMNTGAIQRLIEHRDSSKVATTYKSPHDHLPEPLITIWEPRSHQILLSRLSEEKTCPRRALLNSNIKIIEPLDTNALFNANTPEDLIRVKEIIENGKRLAEI